LICVDSNIKCGLQICDVLAKMYNYAMRNETMLKMQDKTPSRHMHYQHSGTAKFPQLSFSQ